MSSKISRRTFGKTAAGLAAVASLKASSFARAADANKKFNLALIGCGGMGRYKLNNFCDSGRVNVVALCDVDPAQSAQAAEIVEKKLSQKAKQTKNFHDVINDKSIDIVIVATPDHWHAIPMILAAQAGKDIYCEKPCCHNIHEGQVMLKAAQKYNRIVQIGTHQRSIPHIQEGRQLIRDGKLGLISMTNTFTYGNDYPTNMGNDPDTDPPAGVDYDTWLGPAPVRKFNARRFHNKWRWYFDYGCGMVGDWNVHLQDIIMWTLGAKAPISVCTSGGHLLLKDDRDTPDVMQAVSEFGPIEGIAPAGFVQTYTMRKTSGKPWFAGGYGMDFSGTNGLMHLTRNDYQITADRENWEKPDSPFRIEGFNKQHDKADEKAHVAHVANFLDCVTDRKTPIASIESHYHSVVGCHLANVSLKLGRGFAETDLLGKTKRKTGDMKGINGGRNIYWNAEKALCYKDAEHKIEDKEANALLSRDYRKGFELPTV